MSRPVGLRHDTAAFGNLPVAPSAVRWFGRLLCAFVRREFLEASRYRAAFLTRLLAVAASGLSLWFFSRFIGAAANQHLVPYGGDYFAFGLCGLVAVELQQIGVGSLASRVRMAQLTGSLEAQLGTPAPPWLVLSALPAYEIAAALVRAASYLSCGPLFFGVTFHPNALTLLIGVPLLLLAFGGIGLAAAAITMVVRRSNPVGVILGGASALLCGVVYPVSVLPPWLRDVGRFLPLTHGLEVVRRGLLLGEAPSQLAAPILALLGFAVVFGALGTALFAWALRRARVDGSLSQF
ncbi:MAG TPA: ABC transporter permease [Polyangia bacterium]